MKDRGMSPDSGAPENGMVVFTILDLADLKRGLHNHAEWHGWNVEDIKAIGIEVEPKHIYRVRVFLEDPDVIFGRQLLNN